MGDGRVERRIGGQGPDGCDDAKCCRKTGSKKRGKKNNIPTSDHTCPSRTSVLLHSWWTMKPVDNELSTQQELREELGRTQLMLMQVSTAGPPANSFCSLLH